MPLYTFNFTSPSALGEARTFRQELHMTDKAPRGSRFYIRQVSVTSTDSFANSFKYVNLYIPELMGVTEQTKFVNYTADANGSLQLSATPFDGFRYFLSDALAQPLTLNVFPNLNLGRHHLTSNILTLELTPFSNTNVLGKLYSYSVVIEWNTE
jgi:hypothetical protein